MDKFPETYNSPRLNHEEIENLDILIISKEIESLIKSKPTDKSPEQDSFTGEFFHTFKRRINSNPSKNLLKYNRKEYFQTHFMRPALPWYQNWTINKITGQHPWST